MGFPQTRMRRLVRQTVLSVDDLVYPLFVKEGEGIREPIESMTGCFHFSPEPACYLTDEEIGLR